MKVSVLYLNTKVIHGLSWISTIFKKEDAGYREEVIPEIDANTGPAWG